MTCINVNISIISSCCLFKQEADGAKSALTTAKGLVEDGAVKLRPTEGEMDAESAEKDTLPTGVPAQSLEVKVFY